MRTAHVIRGIVPSVARSRAHSSARLPNRMPKSRAPTTSQQIAGLWAAAEGKPPPQRKHNNNKPQANATTKKKRTARKHFDPQKTNAAFERCYSRLVPADEWQEFLSALRRPLPTTFSFVGTGCASVSPLLVQREFEAVVATLGERASRGPGSDGGARHFHSTSAPTSSLTKPTTLVVPAGCRVILRLQVRKGGHVSSFLRTEAAPIERSARRLAWFPHGRGWQLDTPRKELSALRSTCRELRTFLEVHTQLGRINRQEAVSMLPPLLLRAKPGHAVLDLCAAPGSKTVLLLSHLVGGGRGDEGGVVVANDINPMRCSKLRVRVGRSRVPGCMVTVHPAQLYPQTTTLFDRVLTDVPCSGDGTLRKNPDIWGSWQPNFSASLHPLQISILERGLQLLKPGGYLVYSTCSFSPVEDEAVVAAVLQGACGIGVELVDVHGELVGLRSTRGVHSWDVTAADDGSGLSSWEEVTEEQRVRWRLCPSLFPPPPDVAERLGLHRTMRILPHHNDTGGFFVALLHKSESAPPPPPPPPPATTSTTTTSTRTETKTAAASAAKEVSILSTQASEGGGGGGGGGGENGAAAASAAAVAAEEELLAMVEEIDDDDGDDAGAANERDQPLHPTPDNPDGWLRFCAVGEGSQVAAELRSFYGLRGTFPMSQLLSAYSHTTSRRLYLTSPAGAAALTTTPGLRILAAGVKVLEKDESIGVPCGFRIVQEGALHLLPHMTKRVLRASPLAMMGLLEARTLELPVGLEIKSEIKSAEKTAGQPTPAATGANPTTLSSPALLKLRDQLAAMRPNGSCIVVCEGGGDGGDGGAGGAPPRCAVALMKYTDKATLFISEGERNGLIADLLTYHADPPTREQLRPLPTAELARRAALLKRSADAELPNPDGATAGGMGGREEALDAVASALALRPRPERKLQGEPLQPAMRSRLLAALRALKWPKESARPGVTAEHYLVFSSRRGAADLGTRHPHHELRAACDELLHWYRSAAADPTYRHTAIAITKNFCGSPHIDTFDRCPQLAVSLGEFEGGSLCVESDGGGHIDVFDTHDKLAKVDGRRVHWVKAFRGRERYSIIFYNTAEGETTPEQQQQAPGVS